MRQQADRTVFDDESKLSQFRKLPALKTFMIHVAVAIFVNDGKLMMEIEEYAIIYALKIKRSHGKNCHPLDSIAFD